MHKILEKSFKISLVFSVSFVEIMNQLTPFFVSGESFSDIFDFVAGVIVIPIVFEWIAQESVDKKD